MGYRDMCYTEDIINKILTKYEIENTPDYREKIRKKVTAICENIPAVKNGENINLWDKTRIKPKGSKKADHIFTEDEANAILNNKELQSYIVKNISINSEELKKRLEEEVAEEKELKKSAKQINKRNAELDKLPEMNTPNYDDFEDLTASHFYSREEAHQEKLFMMIEALFLKHFTPIDEELLWNDMNKMPFLASTNTDFTPEIMRAIKRFQNKDYYKPLDN